MFEVIRKESYEHPSHREFFIEESDAEAYADILKRCNPDDESVYVTDRPVDQNLEAIRAGKLSYKVSEDHNYPEVTLNGERILHIELCNIWRSERAVAPIKPNNNAYWCRVFAIDEDDAREVAQQRFEEYRNPSISEIEDFYEEDFHEDPYPMPEDEYE